MKTRISMVAMLALGSGTVYAGSETWTSTNIWASMEYSRAGDFNGDGRTDIVSPGGHTWYIKLSNGVNNFSHQTHTQCNNPYAYGNYDWVRVGDFDGDGRDDYVSPNGSTAHYYSWPYFGFPPPPLACPSYGSAYINPSWGSPALTWAGDFNGDGYDDIASASGSNVYMKFGGPNASWAGFGSATWTVSNQWGQGAYTKAGDFNGDGLTDIASFAGGTAYMKLSTGSGFTSTTWAVVNQWNQGAYTFAGDFNGDGIDDVASCGGSVCYMKRSTGSGWTNPGNEAIDPTWNNAGFTYVGDFEGDFNDDIGSAAYNYVYMKLVSQ